MIYYIGLFIYIFIVYIFSLIIKNKKRGRKFFFILVCLGIILFQGFRDFSVGIDLIGYIPSYTKIGNIPISNFFDIINLKYQNYEKGYILLNKIIFLLGCSEREFLIIITGIIQIPIFYTFYKYSENYLISVLWYFSFGNFFMTFSGLRQSIAMALGFFAYYFIKNNEKYKFIFFIIFASFFHKSAIFCLILYPLYYIKIDKRKIIFILTFLFLIFLFKTKIFFIMNRLYYGSDGLLSETKAYTMLIIYLILYILSLYLSKEEKDYQGLRNILLFLVIIYIFAPINNIVTRIGYPLTLYMTIFIPKMILNIKVKPYFIYIGSIYLTLIWCCYYFAKALDFKFC